MNKQNSFAQIIQRKPGEFHLEILDSHCKQTVASNEKSWKLVSYAESLGYSKLEGTLVDASWLGVCETGDDAI